jgi:hypothetical protein
LVPLDVLFEVVVVVDDEGVGYFLKEVVGDVVPFVLAEVFLR